MSTSISVTTLLIGSIFSKSVISLEIDVSANVGSPPTEEILPLEMAVAIDCSNWSADFINAIFSFSATDFLAKTPPYGKAFDLYPPALL